MLRQSLRRLGRWHSDCGEILANSGDDNDPCTQQTVMKCRKHYLSVLQTLKLNY